MGLRRDRVNFVVLTMFMTRPTKSILFYFTLYKKIQVDKTKHFYFTILAKEKKKGGKKGVSEGEAVRKSSSHHTTTAFLLLHCLPTTKFPTAIRDSHRFRRSATAPRQGPAADPPMRALAPAV